MRILWIAPSFLHPTIGGGQIRTLGLLRPLSRRHEIHYVAFADPAQPEGLARADEYSFHAYPFPFPASHQPPTGLPARLARLVSPMPAAILHYRSPELKLYIDGLLAQTAFDRVVADFLVMASNCPRLEKSVLFEHNVETMIWRRHAEHASLPADRRLFRQQARRMFTFEREACRSAGSVIAVSEQDATLIRTMFGAEEVCPVPTGVDAGYYAPPASTQPVADLVFTGAMDWHANVDGVLYFLDRILPKIRCRRPQTTFVVVGKSPHPEILDRARHDPQLRVTGTVADVRPYLWGASVSVVPLRIGSGTRLKIYEAMAAGVPVVSTALGAEGLELTPGQDICIADDPAEFAARCVELLEDRERRSRMSAAARQLVTERFSWERVARSMEQALESAPSACS